MAEKKQKMNGPDNKKVRVGDLLQNNDTIDVSKDMGELKKELIARVKANLPKRFKFNRDIDTSTLIGIDTINADGLLPEITSLRRSFLANLEAALPKKFNFADEIDISKLLGENDKDGYATAFAFSSMKRKLLGRIKDSLPDEFDFDKSVNVAGLLGTNEKDQILTATRFTSLKWDLLKRIRKALPDTFEFDNMVKITDLLGVNSSDQILTAIAFAKMKSKLLKKMDASLPDEFNWNANFSIGDLFGVSEKTNAIGQIQLALLRQSVIKQAKAALKAGAKSGVTGEAPEALQQVAADVNVDGRTEVIQEAPTVKTPAAPIVNVTSPTAVETTAPEISVEPTAPQTIIKTSPIEVPDDHPGFRTNKLLEQIVSFFQRSSLQDVENQREQDRLFTNIADNLEGAGAAGVATPDNDKNSSGGGLLKGIGKSLKGLGAGLSGLGKGLANLGKGIGKSLGGIIQGTFTGLSKGLRALSDPKLLIGVAVLGALTGVLWLASKAFKQFGNINWKDVLIGVGVLAVMGAGLAAIGGAAPMMLVGSIALIAVAAAIGIAGYAFKQFADIDWKGVGIGLGILAMTAVVTAALGSVAALMIAGAVGVAAVGAALIPAAIAFEKFGGISWGDVKTGLKILGIAAIAMTAFGLAAPLAIVGAGAIAAVGVALIPAAAAFEIFGRAAELFQGVFERLVLSLERIGNISGDALSQVAVGIKALGGALLEFAGGTLLAGLVDFFTKNPFRYFERIGAQGEGLALAAKSIVDLRAALDLFNSKNDKSLLSFFTKDTAQKIGNFTKNLAKSIDPRDIRKTTSMIDTLADSFTNLLNVMRQVGDATLEGLSGKIAIPGEFILQGAAEGAALAASAPVTIYNEAPSRKARGSVNNTTNNVSYSQSNHIDDTMQNAIYINRF